MKTPAKKTKAQRNGALPTRALTKREHIAALAMTQLIGKTESSYMSGSRGYAEDVAREAVMHADALLDQLPLRITYKGKGKPPADQ